MRAWIALAIVLAIHVVDEALTGFLDFYNPLVRDIRSRVSWFPMPRYDGRPAGDSKMRTIIVFVTGLVMGVAIESGLAQGGRIVGLNHVAVSVHDYKGVVDFYVKQMGFREAFSFREPDGTPYFSYLQVNRNTFIEVMQATPQRPAGCPHFGLEVENLDALVGQLKQKGVDVRAPSVSPRTQTRIANVTAPGGVNMELLEFGPASLHRKVIDAWK
jgi:catechol 2,3-dioxygenase-like lactoylglutathione lyase family enzyme